MRVIMILASFTFTSVSTIHIIVQTFTVFLLAFGTLTVASIEKIQKFLTVHDNLSVLFMPDIIETLITRAISSAVISFL